LNCRESIIPLIFFPEHNSVNILSTSHFVNRHIILIDHGQYSDCAVEFCSQKLIAYDHLEGDPGLEGGKNFQLFMDILNIVCGCVDNTSPDRYVPH
jgi:hypothetical protein